MRASRAILLTLAFAALWATPVVAQDGDVPPPAQEFASPAGHTEVNYFNAGTLTSATEVPTSSMFWASGAGAGGGEPTPCGEFTRPVLKPHDPDGKGPKPPRPTTVEVTTPSLNWNFTEVEAGYVWEPEKLAKDFRHFYSSAPYAPWILERFHGIGVPVGEGSRRFRVECLPTRGARAVPISLPFVDVALTDPFWNPLDRLGLLWDQVRLPPYSVVEPEPAKTYGGLVINMPTWLQIDSAAWEPYFSPVDHYMGWDSQLQLFPASLEYAVSTSDGESYTVPCSPGDDVGHDGGVTPARPDDMPRYSTQGQLDGYSCTWVPQAVGEVTIRATITYDVVLNISGFTAELDGYEWSSDPLTLRSDELRFVNVTPEGGF